MKRKTAAPWFTRLLGAVLACAFLWGLAGCEQPAGNNGQGEEKQVEENEKEQEQEKQEEEQEKEEEQEEEEEKEEEEQPGPAAKLTGILISSPPEILYYLPGETLNPAGLIVEGLYDDNTSRTLGSGEYTLGAVDTSVAGVYRVEVRAGDYTASFAVEVSASVLQSVSVSAPGVVVRYLGQVLGTEGFTVTGHFSSGNRTLSAFSVKGYNRAKRGAQTVTVSANGKTAELSVTVKVPAGATVQADIQVSQSANSVSKSNNAFIKGQSLNLASQQFRAAVTCNNVTALLLSGAGIDVTTDITGFDPGRTGKQTITLTLDEKSVTLEVYVADIEPKVYFDYGFMRTADDPNGWGKESGRTEGCYHTRPGKTLALSPVRVLLGYDRDYSDLGVSYAWTVTPRDGSPGLNPPSTTGEFLSLTPAAPGSWTVGVTVTGRNFVDGSTVSKTAETAVICDAGTLTPGTFPLTTRHFSPGQFAESGNGAGWSLGAFGGYVIKSVTHKDRYYIPGNAFGTWFEPGVVWFQEDLNGNSLPDEMWYELKVEGDPLITRRYSLTYFKYGDGSSVNEYDQIIREIYWVDGQGHTGQINGGWPRLWGVSNDDGAWVTYTGTLLKDTLAVTNCVDTAQEWFPVDGAVAADNSPVTLTNVRFVKVHTGILSYGGVFGDISTEIGSQDDRYYILEEWR